MGVDNPADVWSSGWMVVGKDNVIIPRNLLIELPANRLTLQQLFVPTPGNPTSGPPAACLANGESGLAKVDRCNARVLGAYVTIFANRMDSGHVIAGDVRLQKAAESLTGTVTYINHTDGYFRVNGVANPGAVDDNTGTMVRMNDPGPPGNPGFGRHTIQQGFGCLPGSLNCSADPRFTADEENYTLTFQTGFPVCIPSAANGAGANGAGDPNCPLTNRPGSPPLVAPPPIPVPGGLFPFVSPQPPTVGGTVDNSVHFAPIILGDSITAFGNYELIPDNVLGAQFFSAHTLTVSADLATRNDPNQPDYVILREVGWDSPPYPAARVRVLFVGNATLHGLPLGCGGGGGVCSPDTAVDVYSNHYDQSNTPHRVPLYSTVNDKKGPVAFVQSMGAFQIHPGIDLEFDPARFSKKPDLEPCPILLLAETQLAGEPPTPAGFIADVNAVCSNPQPVDQTAAVLENFKLVAPIAKEVFAITRHKQDNPGVQSFDIHGNVAPNGQYLSPIPTEWAGYEDIDIGLMKTPYTFSGIPWLLDRRVGPNGCIGACEGTPQPLSPFPFEGFDPRQVALRPGTNTPTVALTMPDPNRIIQFWPFGPGNQLPWNAAALTPAGLPPIAPVPNLAFLVTVLPPPPATGVTLTALPASPQNAGTPVVFTAAATGGSGTYEYRFSRTIGGVLSVVQPYSTSPAWVWDTTGVAAGTDNVQVDARSAGSVNATEATAAVSYTIGSAAASGLTLTATPASPVAGGDNVVFTAIASGGGTYEYEFLGRVAGSGPLSLAQAYGPSNTFTWNTAGIQSGTYEIQVYARRVGAAVPFEATQTMTYVVNTPAATGVSLTATPPSPQIPGTLVTFNAAATGGGAYEYAFTGRQVGGTLTMSQSYSNV
ncbi:MAG TPA: hypothetical protein VFF01_03580, partial [Candidatus Deferrimicrobiaceae bacterium]|nr:hypothetical protein [Candidatus Deferrimicrobiaceae bacterium]